jgi:hypothetical protein
MCSSSIKVTLALLDLFQNTLEAFLEFASIFCPGNQGAEVKGDKPFVLKRIRNITGDDSLRQAFYYGGLADSGLTDKHGIVLCPPSQNLNHSTNFAVPSDYRIQLSFARTVGQVVSVDVERSSLVLFRCH